MYIPEIGSRIRQARKARGLTQATLAARAGIARETLSQLEGGLAKDLGVAKILRLLKALDLEMQLLDAQTRSAIDYVSLAAAAGSTGFREALAEEDLVRALLSGIPPPRKGPHLRRLLEDSPPQLIRALVSQVSRWSRPGKVEKNLTALAKKLDVKARSEWTKPD